MKQIVIGVHGLGNKPPNAQLKKWWLKSIRDGLRTIGKESARIPFELVYWADTIYPEPLSLQIQDKDDPRFLVEPYLNVADNSSSTIDGRTGGLLRHVNAIIERLYQNRGMGAVLRNVSTFVIERYFKDLNTYYGDDSPRAMRWVIQERLTKTLLRYRNYKIFLIGHSMGSLIAYDVLMNLIGQVDIDTLVTIGSPLGLPYITEQIVKQQGAGADLSLPKIPDNINKAWYNLSDPRDKIALDSSLNDDFAPSRSGITIRDISVRTNYAINGEYNHHKSFGYLQTAEMAALVDEFLKTGIPDRLLRMYHRWSGRRDRS